MASASGRADTLLPRAMPEEATRAQALRAHAAFYQGDIYAARELIRGCHEKTQTVAQRAMSLNTQGMIDMALGDYDSASTHLGDAAAVADGFGLALTSHIEDNLAFLKASVGDFHVALPCLQSLREHLDTLDPTMVCYVLTHEGTAMRRAGDPEAATQPTQQAIEIVSVERDPYLAYNAMANLALCRGLVGVEQQLAVLRNLSTNAAAAGISFVEHKAAMFEAVLANAFGNKIEAIALLEQCLPRQFALGHVNLIAQELCPRPELTSLVLRRHKSNGLGPLLVDALSRHWRFGEVAPILADLCPSQVGTWIDHISTGRRPPAGGDIPGNDARRAPARSSRMTSEPSALDELTPRERQVLQLMAVDRTNEEIAGDLFIAIPTVKTHVNHILRKLGQTKRVGAVLEYQRLTGPFAAEPGRRPPLLHPP
jgi:ATP/maltotriose-dependent transcriptional regulator MalT